MSGHGEYPSNGVVVATMLLMPFVILWAVGMGIWDSVRRRCR